MIHRSDEARKGGGLGCGGKHSGTLVRTFPVSKDGKIIMTKKFKCTGCGQYFYTQEIDGKTIVINDANFKA